MPRRRPTVDLNVLTEEALIIISNELRMIREQSGKRKESSPDVVASTDRILRVLTYVKRNTLKEDDDELTNMTHEQFRAYAEEKLLKKKNNKKAPEKTDE